MLQQFSAQYFRQDRDNVSSVGTLTLTDNDLIRGGDGNDRLTGRGGEDTFAFGADARDGNRDRDVITDFNAAEDTIVFEATATRSPC